MDKDDNNSDMEYKCMVMVIYLEWHTLALVFIRKG